MSGFWNGRPVFVTGCTGFLGSHLVKTLKEEGAVVTGLVRDRTARSDILGDDADISLVHGSLEDYPVLERVLNEYEIDTVFHVGAQAIVGTANRNPLSTFEANICGTWNVLEACRRNPLVRRIVVASSDKAYGDQAVLPYNEDMPLMGRHPYDVSKSCADLIAQAYHKTYGLPVCITRCGNLFGEGDTNFSRIIPQTIRSIIRGEAPIIRSDGTYIRDYFYVGDAVSAYMLLAEKMESKGLFGEAFNFSNEVQVTVLELVRRILDIMGSDLEPVILNQAGNEIRHQYLDASKSKRLLGWAPGYSLDEGLRRTIEWYKAYFAKISFNGASESDAV